MMEDGVMPKEQVMAAKWEKYITGATGEENKEYGSTYPEMYVRWAAGGHGNVQLHMVTYPDTLWQELQVRDGHPVVWPAPEKEVFSGVLTREDINNLIKVLRRARDSAYGRDE